MQNWSLSEDATGRTAIIDLIRGELVICETNMTLFASEGLERMVGKKVPARMKKWSRHGKRLLVFRHQNVVLEKYEAKKSGKFTIVQPRALLPKAFCKEFHVDKFVREGLDVLTTEGIRFGMGSNKVRLLITQKLEEQKKAEKTKFFVRKVAKKDFTTLVYRLKRSRRFYPSFFFLLAGKVDYRIEFTFSGKDRLIAMRFGMLREK